MTRTLLDPSRLSPGAVERLARFHPEVVAEVQQAIEAEALVVVGMAQNPHVKEIRKALAGAGIPYTYLEYGSYVSKWRERLAVKLWSGWPTFPQVFLHGHLLGGTDLTLAALADGSLKKELAKS